MHGICRCIFSGSGFVLPVGILLSSKLQKEGIFILHRFSSVYVALLLSVFLLAVPPGGYVDLVSFKYILFLLLGGGYCVVMIVTRVQLALTGAAPIGSIKGRWKDVSIPALFLLGFLLFTILSALLSDYPGTFQGPFRQEGVLTIGIYVLSCLFLSRYFRPQKWMLYLLGIGAGLFCLLSFLQLTGANPLTLFPRGINFYGVGIYFSEPFIGTIGNVGLAAAFLSLAAGVLAMALIKFDFKERWFLAPSFFLLVLLIFVLNSDAAFLALGVGFLLMLPVSVTSQKGLARTLLVLAMLIGAFGLSRVLLFQDGPIALAPGRLSLPLPGGLSLLLPTGLVLLLLAGLVLLFALWVKKGGIFEKIPAKWYRIGAFGGLFSILCLGLAYLWFFGSNASGMIYEASQMLRGRWEDAFGSGRVFIWRNVIEGLEGNLLFGTGPDTLGYWPTDPLIHFAELVGAPIVASIDAAHNEYLHILATGGLFSLLAYLGALFYAMAKWIRHPENQLSAVAGTGVLFYCIQAFFGISMFLTAPFFWACFAILLYAQRNPNAEA